YGAATRATSARRTRGGPTAGPTGPGSVDVVRVPVTVRDVPAAGRGEALQVAAGPLGLRVDLQQRPEARPVAGDQQMRQFVQQHVVEDILGHAPDPVGDADGAVDRGAGAPAAGLVADPADADRGSAAVEISERQLAGPPGQLAV